jgi:hypothetical protein
MSHAAPEEELELVFPPKQVSLACSGVQAIGKVSPNRRIARNKKGLVETALARSETAGGAQQADNTE